MRIKALALLCALLLLLTSIAVSLPMSVQAAVGDTVYIKKHVSLLYDNSGSMSDKKHGTNLRWCYASYAAQIFTGLLNETDSLTFTFMNGVGGKTDNEPLVIDLAADRQQEVNKVLNKTNYASGGTPFDSIDRALKELEDIGLKSDEKIGNNQIAQGEQYWLVLTTDGVFNYDNNVEVPVSKVEDKLKGFLSKYSNLQVVYFGIGTKGATNNVALDLRNNATLNAYPNFTAVYAEDQTEIISTMRSLANRISGRYSVTDDIKQDGNKVTFYISGETSPIRNVAVLAQNTSAQLVRATSDSGDNLTVSRPATIKYPTNSSYHNMPSGTKGGSTALIINPDGKLPPGNITLEFSEPVSMDDLSLMFEPAICVNLTLQRKDASGEWVDVPYGEKVLAEQELRVNYLICEDGTNDPIDPAKLPGIMTAQISCGGQTIEAGKTFQLAEGASTITATVSMMDGNYVVSTSRNVTVQSLSVYTYEVSPALEFYPDDLATNSSQYIDFKIFYKGNLATADQLTNFKIDAGELKGMFTTPSTGVYRFTPTDDARPVGTYTVSLMFQSHVVATQTVRVKEEELSYTAVAGDPLELYTNETEDNQTPVIFTVTKHLGEKNSLLVEAEMGAFRIEAVAGDGTILKGEVKYQADGQLHFIVKDDIAIAGEYDVNLYWQDNRIAQGHVTVLQYNAVYTAEVFPIGDNTVDRFHLLENKNGLAFVVYADGEALNANQLQAMLNQQKIVLSHSPQSDVMEMLIAIGDHNGTPALTVIPTAKCKYAVLHVFKKPFIAMGTVKDGPLSVTMDVQAVYGTSVSGSMEVTNDPGEWLFWLLILFILLGFALLVLLIIFCNLRMPRIAPGTFESGTIVFGHDSVVYSIERLKRHRQRVHVQLTLAPERIEVNNRTFYADRNELGERTSPQTFLSPRDPQLYSTYVMSHWDVQELRAFFADGACDDVDAVNGLLGGLASTVPPEDEPTTDTPIQLNSGEALLQCIDGEVWRVWFYTQDE